MKNSSTDRLEGPELFIGLVGAVGTDLEIVSTALCGSLSDVNYSCQIIRLSDLLHEIETWKTLEETIENKRIEEHMDAGDEYRKTIEQGDALALHAIGAIRADRANATQERTKPITRCAFLFNSLKHPDEVETLRRVYGSSFTLIAAYSPQETRIQNLVRKIAESNHDLHTNKYRKEAMHLIQRDEIEPEKKYGQNVRETFPLADVFIDASNREGLRKSVKRFVELLFNYPFHTPSRDEYGMFHAQASALRSASLARQVGAAITTEDGDIIAVGCNEVPKAGGGLYWCQDKPDHRDFVLGYDTNDKMNILGDILNRFSKEKWLSEEKNQKKVKELVEEALAGEESSLMKGSQLMNLIEFGRVVHAEMAALIDAA